MFVMSQWEQQDDDEGIRTRISKYNEKDRKKWGEGEPNDYYPKRSGIGAHNQEVMLGINKI